MKKQKLPALFAGFGLFLLIIDTKTALLGANKGFEICCQTLIPSLFPFIFLSSMLTSAIASQPTKWLRPLGRLLQIPAGSESIFLIGVLGGYPTGAQAVAQAVKKGCISRENGNRMLAFCSNAGPAFLFGMGSSLFTSNGMCWLLWAIHIISAILVARLITAKQDQFSQPHADASISAAFALRQSLITMAMVCGWVILFRILLAYLEFWIFWWLPKEGTYIVSGLLEIANGCCRLAQIDNITLRAVMFSGFLGFGGLCVMMQTYSVCNDLDCRWYLLGKLLQSIFSILLCSLIISRGMKLLFLVSILALYTALYFFMAHTAKRDSIPAKCSV